MYIGVFIALLLVAFFVKLGLSVLEVYERAAAEFRPVPDMSGGIAAILGALAMLLPAIVQVMQVVGQYGRERLDQQARGIPPTGIPTQPPPVSVPTAVEPSPTGGLVNNEALGGGPS
jgi:hypothetical protein